MVACRTPGVEFQEVVGAEILVRLIGGQQVVEDLQLRMRHGDHGAFLAASARHTMELRPKVGILCAGRCPSRLAQGRLEPAVTLDGPTAGLLAGTLVVARADGCPRAQMIVAGKLAHVRPDFRHHILGRGEQMEKKHKGIWPALVLFFLAPAIGELLSGSAPPAEFFNTFTLFLSCWLVR